MQSRLIWLLLVVATIAIASNEQVRGDGSHSVSQQTATTVQVPAGAAPKIKRTVRVLARTPPANTNNKPADGQPSTTSINNVDVSPQISVDLKAPSESNQSIAPKPHEKPVPLHVKSDNRKINRVPYRSRTPSTNAQPEEPKKEGEEEEEAEAEVEKEEVEPKEKQEVEDVEVEVKATPTPYIEPAEPEQMSIVPVTKPAPQANQYVFAKAAPHVMPVLAPASDSMPIDMVRQLLQNQQQQQQMLKMLIESSRNAPSTLNEIVASNNWAKNVLAGSNNQQVNEMVASGNQQNNVVRGVGNVESTVLENVGNSKQTIIRNSGNQEQHHEEMHPTRVSTQPMGAVSAQMNRPKRTAIITRPFEHLFDGDDVLRSQNLDEIIYKSGPEYQELAKPQVIQVMPQPEPRSRQAPMFVPVPMPPTMSMPMFPLSTPPSFPTIPQMPYYSPGAYYQSQAQYAAGVQWASNGMMPPMGSMVPMPMIPMIMPWMLPNYTLPVGQLPYGPMIPAVPVVVRPPHLAETPNKHEITVEVDKSKVADIEVVKPVNTESKTIELEVTKPIAPEVQYIERKRLVPIDDDDDAAANYEDETHKNTADALKIITVEKDAELPITKPITVSTSTEKPILVNTVQQKAQDVGNNLMDSAGKLLHVVNQGPVELVKKPVEVQTVQSVQPEKQQRYREIIERVPVS